MAEYFCNSIGILQQGSETTGTGNDVIIFMTSIVSLLDDKEGSSNSESELIPLINYIITALQIIRHYLLH